MFLALQFLMLLIVVQNVIGIEVDKQLSSALDIPRTDQKRIISVWASLLNPIMVNCNQLGSEFACECPRLRLNCYGATFNWLDEGLIRWPDRAQSQIGSLARTWTLTPPQFFVPRANEGRDRPQEVRTSARFPGDWTRESMVLPHGNSNRLGGGSNDS